MFKEKRESYWYEGAVSQKVIKQDDNCAYDLVSFDTEDFEGKFQREYQVYRLFTIIDRVELSVDYTYKTPVFDTEKEAVIEFEKFEKFLSHLIQREFRC